MIGTLLTIGISAPQQAQAREDNYCFLALFDPEETGGEGTPDANEVPTENCSKHKKECEETRLGLIDNEDTEVLTECYKNKIDEENND